MGEVAVDQRVAYAALERVAKEGRVLALAPERFPADAESRLGIEHADIGGGAGRERAGGDAEDAGGNGACLASSSTGV